MVGKQLIMNRQFYEDKNGFLIMKPKRSTNNQHIPLECPVCELLMRDHTDVAIFQKWSCCDYCYITWAATNKGKWEDGWRPTQKEVSIVRKKRLSLPSYGVR